MPLLLEKQRVSNGVPSFTHMFFNASWIWTTEVRAPYAPGDDRAFRATFTTPSGRVAASALILIAADDFYSLYLNGQFIAGSGVNFGVPLQPDSNLFADFGSNLVPNTPTWIVTGIEITHADGDVSLISSDVV